MKPIYKDSIPAWDRIILNSQGLLLKFTNLFWTAITLGSLEFLMFILSKDSIFIGVIAILNLFICYFSYYICRSIKRSYELYQQLRVAMVSFDETDDTAEKLKLLKQIMEITAKL